MLLAAYGQARIGRYFPVLGDLIDALEFSAQSGGTRDYKKGETNSSTRVVARFNQWQTDAEGYNLITHTVSNVTRDMYFRLRGTNLGLDVPNETDADGNPLRDELMGVNSADKAWADLWFYSNLIFVEAED